MSTLNIQARRELKKRFPLESRVQPTRQHPFAWRNPRTVHRKLPHTGTVKGHSRDGSCIRIQRDGARAIETYSSNFYEPMPNPTLFHEKLLDAGYQVFPRSPISNADWGLQKRIKSPNGETLYFINVMVYDWRNNPRFPEDWAYTPEVHFYTKNSGTEPVQFKIQANFEFELPESMEAWFSFIYHQLKCVPDPHNND